MTDFSLDIPEPGVVASHHLVVVLGLRVILASGDVIGGGEGVVRAGLRMVGSCGRMVGGRLGVVGCGLRMVTGGDGMICGSLSFAGGLGGLPRALGSDAQSLGGYPGSLRSLAGGLGGGTVILGAFAEILRSGSGILGHDAGVLGGDTDGLLVNPGGFSFGAAFLGLDPGLLGGDTESFSGLHFCFGLQDLALRIDGLLSRSEGGTDGLVQEGAGDVRDVNLHVHIRVVDGNLLAVLVSRPADEVEGRLVVGLRLAHVLGGDDDAADAHVLGLIRRVLTHEDRRVLRIDGNVTAARQGPLRVRIDARLDVVQRGPVDGHAVILQANAHGQIGTDSDVGKCNCAHSDVMVSLATSRVATGSIVASILISSL